MAAVPDCFRNNPYNAETGTKPHGDRREMAVTKGENRDARQSNENGSDLPGAESLAQNNGAEQDVHERRHEIAQTSFEDVTDVDCPNEDAANSRQPSYRCPNKKMRCVASEGCRSLHGQRSCQLSRTPRNTMVQTKRCARISKAGTSLSNFQ